MRTKHPRLDVRWTDEFLNYIVEIGYEPDKGARGLENCITREMIQPIADVLTEQDRVIPPGSIFFFAYDRQHPHMNILDSIPESQPSCSSSSDGATSTQNPFPTDIDLSADLS